MKERTKEIHVLWTPEELEVLHEKMKQAGIKNRSAYVRKMSLDGYCVKLDIEGVRELATLMRRCSNNLNQYAKRANETGSIYKEDIDDVKDRQEEMWELLKKIMEELAAVR